MTAPAGLLALPLSPSFPLPSPSFLSSFLHSKSSGEWLHVGYFLFLCGKKNIEVWGMGQGSPDLWFLCQGLSNLCWHISHPPQQSGWRQRAQLCGLHRIKCIWESSLGELCCLWVQTYGLSFCVICPALFGLGKVEDCSLVSYPVPESHCGLTCEGSVIMLVPGHSSCCVPRLWLYYWSTIVSA